MELNGEVVQVMVVGYADWTRHGLSPNLGKQKQVGESL